MGPILSRSCREHKGDRASPPKAPDDWTWDDWAARALHFTKEVNRNSPVRDGMVLQMKNLLFNMMVIQSLPRAYGGDWMDAKGKVTVDSPAYRTGLELYKNLYDEGEAPGRCRRHLPHRGQHRPPHRHRPPRADEEWQLQHRHMQIEGMAEIDAPAEAHPSLTAEADAAA